VTAAAGLQRQKIDPNVRIRTIRSILVRWRPAPLTAAGLSTPENRPERSDPNDQVDSLSVGDPAAVTAARPSLNSTNPLKAWSPPTIGTAKRQRSPASTFKPCDFFVRKNRCSFDEKPQPRFGALALWPFGVLPLKKRAIERSSKIVGHGAEDGVSNF